MSLSKEAERGGRGFFFLVMIKKKKKEKQMEEKEMGMQRGSTIICEKCGNSIL